MSSIFLSLPLQLDNVVRKGTLEKCSLKQSISHHLHLLLTTSLGELSSNDEFGCKIWDSDFDNITNRSKLKDELIQALADTIKAYEPRLNRVRAEVNIQQEILTITEIFKRIKNRIDITISGFTIGTNEPITYRDHFFIGPLSYN